MTSTSFLSGLGKRPSTKVQQSPGGDSNEPFRYGSGAANAKSDQYSSIKLYNDPFQYGSERSNIDQSNRNDAFEGVSSTLSPEDLQFSKLAIEKSAEKSFGIGGIYSGETVEKADEIEKVADDTMFDKRTKLLEKSPSEEVVPCVAIDRGPKRCARNPITGEGYGDNGHSEIRPNLQRLVNKLQSTSPW